MRRRAQRVALVPACTHCGEHCAHVDAEQCEVLDHIRERRERWRDSERRSALGHLGDNPL